MIAKEILLLLEASPADWLLFWFIVGTFALGVLVVGWVGSLWKKLSDVIKTAHKTDLALLELLLKNDPDAIAHHYNGDYYRKHPADRAVAIRGEIARMRAILKANDIEVE